MLFETEAKALNFMKFNAEFIAAGQKGTPVRAYFCRACGGWHVTKHENAGWFKEMEQAQDKTVQWRMELQDITTDFFNNYSSAKDQDFYQLKMDRMVELVDLLKEDGAADGLVARAKNCINQYRIPLIKNGNKEVHKAIEKRLAPVRELAAKLEETVYDFRFDGCVEVATEMKNLLDAMRTEKLVTEATEKYMQMAEMILDKDIFPALRQLVDAVKEAYDKVYIAKIPMDMDMQIRVENLLAQAEKSGIRKSFLKRFKNNIHALVTQSEGLQRKINRIKKYEDELNEQAIKNLLGEVITAMQQGDRRTAEDKLDIVGIYLERMTESESRTGLADMEQKLREMLLQ